MKNIRNYLLVLYSYIILTPVTEDWLIDYAIADYFPGVNIFSFHYKLIQDHYILFSTATIIDTPPKMKSILIHVNYTAAYYS